MELKDIKEYLQNIENNNNNDQKVNLSTKNDQTTN